MNTTTKISDYEQQAIDFANKYGITLKVNSHKYGRYWQDDKESRYIFSCTLSCNGESYNFKFGQSIADGHKEPTLYNVLACMTKNDPKSFEDFCINYGYAPFNPLYTGRNFASNNIYKAVCKEWEGMTRLFSPEILEEMQEIN